ncbi:MAG: aldehyde dehydrogenase [Bdellovibrionales bacterium]|nr:aldehyde dehydrogenase [Bdellovibrionales bacterium]
MKQILNFIDGKHQPSVTGELLDNFHPATGKVSSKVVNSHHEDVELAVQAAKKAFPLWSKMSAKDRAEILIEIGERLKARSQEFAELESYDQGKPVHLAMEVDLPRATANFQFFANYVLHLQESSSQIDGRGINYTLRRPIGVAGLISPWNLPLYLLTWKIAPALAVGNTAVCKPSELTPMTADLLTSVFQEAGLPAGVCNIVYGEGHRAGAALVQHPDVPLISFTGGTQTAESIVRDSAPYFKKLSLELGGKNPNIIFADCDFEKTVATTIKSSFNNQGEICLCGSRIFVQNEIYDTFVQEFVQRTEALVVGDPTQANTFMGPVVSADHRNKIWSYIEGAKKDGLKILTGGVESPVDSDSPWGQGYFVKPTVIAAPHTQCAIMQEEVFGPVVTITPFQTEEEVLTMANSTKYGLSASVWTENIDRAHRMAALLDAGTVWINTWMLRDLRVPFGGMKASGIGREGGEHSIDFYTETKNVCISYSMQPEKG